jgi:hypothetical protein
MSGAWDPTPPPFWGSAVNGLQKSVPSFHYAVALAVKQCEKGEREIRSSVYLWTSAMVNF